MLQDRDRFMLFPQFKTLPVYLAHRLSLLTAGGRYDDSRLDCSVVVFES